MTEKDILDNISQEDIMTRYFGDWELGKQYVNIYREGDTNPGCWFTYRNNILYFVDFGNVIKNMNCFEMCKLYYNCNYENALKHIDYDFKLNLSIENLLFRDKQEYNITNQKQNTNHDTRKIFIEEKKIEYEFIYQDFQSWDISFWKRFKYNKNLIDLMKIKSAKKVFINNKLHCCSDQFNPIFTYNDSIGEFKLYCPYSGKFKKWRTIRPILEGFELLKPANILFITSSYKDVGVLKLLKFEAIAPSSETSYNLIYDNIDYLKSIYKYIYVFHNNDETGKHFSLKLTKELGLYYINIPNNLKPKDPSDYVEQYELNSLYLLILEKFKRDNIEYGMEEIIKS